MNFWEDKQKRNRVIAIGLAGIALVAFVFLLQSGNKKSPIKGTQPEAWSESGEDVYKQKWMAEAKSELELQKEKIKALEQKQQRVESNLEKVLKILEELKKQQQQRTLPRLPQPTGLAQKKEVAKEENLKPIIPPPQNFRPRVINDVVEVKEEEHEAINKETATSEHGQTQNKVQKVNIVIPPGTFVKAVLLSGVDAPTMGQGTAKEYPVLLELLDKAFLPNDWRIDIKKCFAIGWATGDLASERAYIRVDRISCVSRSGKVYVAQGKNIAAVYGEDGKIGLRGRVVAKEGALLARSLVAGFLQGVSKILQQSSTVVSIAPEGSTSTIKPSQATKYAIFGGVSNAADILAKEYQRLIKLTFPVVEINAGRKVDIVFYDMPVFKLFDLKKEGNGHLIR
jgi:conjugal transfer pilus assembly protein TraB